MALQHIPLTGVPARHELVRIDGNAEALRPYLQIKPPEAAKTSPPILAFTRKREIQIPWGEILQDLAVAGSSSIAALRMYFEESWGFEQPVKEVLEAVKDALIKSDGPVQEIETAGDAPPAPELYRTTFDREGNPTAERLAEGVVIRHGTSGRWYLMIPKPAESSQQEAVLEELYMPRHGTRSPGSSWCSAARRRRRRSTPSSRSSTCARP